MSVSKQLRAFLPVDIQDAEGNLTRKVSGAPITAAAISEIAEEAEELEQVLDACEVNNAQHIKRIMALEQLCRDMYRLLAFALDGKPGELAAQASLARSIHDRMDGFGLLEGWKKLEGGGK